MKIHSPIKGFNETTELGPYKLEFKDGVAEVDDLNDGAIAYLKENGYGVGSKKAAAPEAPPEPLDPRSDAADEQVGTKIRDGAVDPAEGDFLGPTNAGEENPHGSKVVNPEIHASEGVRPVKGGVVHVGDPDAQDQAETEHTEDVTDGTPVTVTDAEQAEEPEPESDTLRGQALDDALEAAGLSKSGTADEKRQRLADHEAQG